ncbi:hypothetical protein Esti_006066 [Eimeria stiedai]
MFSKHYQGSGGGVECRTGLCESATPLQWMGAASEIPGGPEADLEVCVHSKRCPSASLGVKGKGDLGRACCNEQQRQQQQPGGQLDGEQLQRRRTGTTQSSREPSSANNPSSTTSSPDVGSMGLTTETPGRAGDRGPPPTPCTRVCSNPEAHRCIACREEEMEAEFHKLVPGYLAAERGGKEGPCCWLSSAVHTIVHVCDCMSPFELDRALAVENLRLERVRDAHAVVLTMAQQYGVDRVLSDPDLMLIIYKYDEMARMYAMMSAPVCYRRRLSYLRRVASSLAAETPGGRKKRHQAAADDELQQHCEPRELQDVQQHQDPAEAVPALGDLDERLRNGMRQQFGFRSLGTLSSTHVPPADASWHLAIQETNGLKIFFRRHASSTLISFRVEGFVEASILNIISVLNEMDLYRDWIPYYSFPLKSAAAAPMHLNLTQQFARHLTLVRAQGEENGLGLREVKKLYQMGRVEQISLLELDFPWPMNNRFFFSFPLELLMTSPLQAAASSPLLQDCCVDIWAADDLDYTNRFFVRITSLDGCNNNPRVPLFSCSSAFASHSQHACIVSPSFLNTRKNLNHFVPLAVKKSSKIMQKHSQMMIWCDFLKALPSPPNKTLRLYCEGGVILVPLGKEKTFMELLWTLDPKAHLSDYIVNFFTKVFAKSSFHAFCKVCADASSGEHARRRAQCPLLYGFVEQRMQEMEKAYERRERSGEGSPPSPGQEAPHAESSRLTSPSSASVSPHRSKVIADSSSGLEKDNNVHAHAPEEHQPKRSRSTRLTFSFRKVRSSAAEAVKT